MSSFPSDSDKSGESDSISILRDGKLLRTPEKEIIGSQDSNVGGREVHHLQTNMQECWLPWIPFLRPSTANAMKLIQVRMLVSERQYVGLQ